MSLLSMLKLYISLKIMILVFLMFKCSPALACSSFTFIRSHFKSQLPFAIKISRCRNPLRFFQSEVLRLYFSALEPWVVWSVLLPSCSSRFICMQMWDHPVCQLPLCHKSSLPGCQSLPLLLLWMNVSSLASWFWTSI